jgi:prepilin-type N-terminal cleavage/methylation domain-containing protein
MMYYSQRKEQVMKKGFTLIELMIVIIIIGILATVGIVQYQAAVEKSRGAEAKAVLGFLRQSCAGIWMETGDSANCNATTLNLGATGMPSTCRSSHWFSYGINSDNANQSTITATRCTASGKTPNVGATKTLVMVANYSQGTGALNASADY